MLKGCFPEEEDDASLSPKYLSAHCHGCLLLCQTGAGRDSPLLANAQRSLA